MPPIIAKGSSISTPASSSSSSTSGFGSAGASGSGCAPFASVEEAPAKRNGLAHLPRGIFLELAEA
eukprot:CAMPEP_0170640480 /NCGR_PEP_ID=MMETSP0224-20130122/40247_1 /TAXON_ID=285029 /ORGANISM="Togula jolla, Strain CCCM 725" /LENGTH=65 /DNA_ID=CAMNT_0010970989 /DNA_START=19 /DNA_END=216 /DNA_ORIENTATION=-